MLAASAEPASTEFTRRDAGRLFAASVVLVARDVGDPRARLPAGAAAARGRAGPRRTSSGAAHRPVRQRRPHRAAARRRAAAASTPAVRLHHRRGAAAVATQQLRELDRKVAPIEAAFAEGVKPEDRDALLQDVAPGLSEDDRATLTGLDAERWTGDPHRGGARARDASSGPSSATARSRPTREAVEGRFAGDLTTPTSARSPPRSSRRSSRPTPRSPPIYRSQPKTGPRRPSTPVMKAGNAARRSSARATASTTSHSRRSATSASTRAASTSRGWSASSCCRCS